MQNLTVWMFRSNSYRYHWNRYDFSKGAKSYPTSRARGRRKSEETLQSWIWTCYDSERSQHEMGSTISCWRGSTGQRTNFYCSSICPWHEVMWKITRRNDTKKWHNESNYWLLSYMIWIGIMIWMRTTMWIRMLTLTLIPSDTLACTRDPRDIRSHDFEGSSRPFSKYDFIFLDFPFSS